MEEKKLVEAKKIIDEILVDFEFEVTDDDWRGIARVLQYYILKGYWTEIRRWIIMTEEINPNYTEFILKEIAKSWEWAYLIGYRSKDINSFKSVSVEPKLNEKLRNIIIKTKNKKDWCHLQFIIDDLSLYDEEIIETVLTPDDYEKMELCVFEKAREFLKNKNDGWLWFASRLNYDDAKKLFIEETDWNHIFEEIEWQRKNSEWTFAKYINQLSQNFPEIAERVILKTDWEMLYEDLVVKRDEARKLKDNAILWGDFLLRLHEIKSIYYLFHKKFKI